MTSSTTQAPPRSHLWRARRRLRMQLILDLSALPLVAVASVVFLLAAERGFAWHVVLLPLAAWPIGSVFAALTLGLGEGIARRGPMIAFGVGWLGWCVAAALLGSAVGALTDVSWWAFALALAAGRLGGLAMLPGALHEIAVQGVVLDPVPVCLADRSTRGDQ